MGRQPKKDRKRNHKIRPRTTSAAKSRRMASSAHPRRKASAVKPRNDASTQLNSVLDRARRHAIEAIRRWCLACGVQPHPRLPDAIDMTFLASTQAHREAGEDDETALAEHGVRNVNTLLGGQDPGAQAELQAAMAQIGEFAAQFDSPDAFFAALGIDQIDDAEA